MGKIIVSENITIDGVVQDPVGDGGFRHGGWGVRLGDADREAWAKVLLDEALAAEALLLGRRSDEWFAARWLCRSGAVGGPAEQHAQVRRVLDPGRAPVDQLDRAQRRRGRARSQLREQLDGDIVLNGSIQLAHALLEHDLVDELRLIIFPVVLGDGERLLGRTSDQQPMRLAGVQAVGDSLALLTYERDRAAYPAPRPGAPSPPGRAGTRSGRRRRSAGPRRSARPAAATRARAPAPAACPAGGPPGPPGGPPRPGCRAWRPARPGAGAPRAAGPGTGRAPVPSGAAPARTR